MGTPLGRVPLTPLSERSSQFTAWEVGGERRRERRREGGREEGGMGGDVRRERERDGE